MGPLLTGGPAGFLRKGRGPEWSPRRDGYRPIEMDCDKTTPTRAETARFPTITWQASAVDPFGPPQGLGAEKHPRAEMWKLPEQTARRAGATAPVPVPV